MGNFLTTLCCGYDFSRSELLDLAKSAYQEKNYHDSFYMMKKIADMALEEELSCEERDLLCSASTRFFQQQANAYNALFYRWEKEVSASKANRMCDQSAKIAGSISAVAKDLQAVLESTLIPSAPSSIEAKVLYLVLKGTCPCHITFGTEVGEQSDYDLHSLKTAYGMALSNLPPYHPYRVTAATLFSTSLHATSSSPERALRIAKQTYDDVMAAHKEHKEYIESHAYVWDSLPELRNTVLEWEAAAIGESAATGDEFPEIQHAQIVPPTRPEHSLALTTSTANTQVGPAQPSKDNQKVEATPISSPHSDDSVLQWIASQPQRAPVKTNNAVPAHVADLEFTWDAVKPLQQMGAGSFGSVYLAEVNHTRVAVKVLVDTQSVAAAASQPSKLSAVSSAQTSVSSASESSMVKEVTILASLRHPNVVQLVGFCMTPPCVAMEYCARGSLYDVMQRGVSDADAAKLLPWGRRVRMAADAAAGMFHLHTRSPQVLHRDIKSLNLLVAADWTVKVGDVGLSKLVEEAKRTSSGAGTATTAGGAANPRWMAPELLADERPTTASDVYSFGVVLWELLSWKLPFSDRAPFAIALAVSKGDRPTIPAAADLPGPDDGLPSPAALQAYLALMQRCWAQEPTQRPDFQAVAAELAAVAALG